MEYTSKHKIHPQQNTHTYIHTDIDPKPNTHTQHTYPNPTPNPTHIPNTHIQTQTQTQPEPKPNPPPKRKTQLLCKNIPYLCVFGWVDVFISLMLNEDTALVEHFPVLPVSLSHLVPLPVPYPPLLPPHISEYACDTLLFYYLNFHSCIPHIS